MHLGPPHKFTLSFVKGAWGILNRRRAKDFRDTTNLIRLYAKVERPTSEQLKLIALTVIQATGQAVFQGPKAFYLSGPSGYC